MNTTIINMVHDRTSLCQSFWLPQKSFALVRLSRLAEKPTRPPGIRDGCIIWGFMSSLL